MQNKRKKTSSTSTPRVSPNLLADLYAALGRLLAGAPLNVAPGFRINMKTVCDEAGRDRSSIKTHAGFDGIRDAIKNSASRAKPRNGSNTKDVEKIQHLEEQVTALRKTLRAQDNQLTEASEIIYRLYIQLNRLEEDEDYIIAKVESARKTSQAVEKAFQIVGFDRFVSRTRAERLTV